MNRLKRPKTKPKFTTISIPTYLYKKVEKRIRGKGFPSVSSFVAYLLREIEASESKKFTQDDKKRIIEKLRKLGYLD